MECMPLVVIKPVNTDGVTVLQPRMRRDAGKKSLSARYFTDFIEKQKRIVLKRFNPCSPLHLIVSLHHKPKVIYRGVCISR